MIGFKQFWDWKKAFVENFSLSASHPTGVGKKYTTTASTGEEVKKKVKDLRAHSPGHNVTVHHKPTGQVRTFRPHEPYHDFHESEVPANAIGGGTAIASYDPMLGKKKRKLKVSLWKRWPAAAQQKLQG